MRAINIEFFGYKRLAKTSCNTDGRMIAFLGPNEAGKSSVLHGLEWFTSGEALDVRHSNRGQVRDDTQAVVRVRYALTDQDRSLLEDLSFEGVPTTFIQARYPDGTVRTGLNPKLRRDPTPIQATLSLLDQFEATWGAAITADELRVQEDEYHEPSLRPWVTLAREVASNPEAAWDAEWEEPISEFIEWLQDSPSEDERAEPELSIEPDADARHHELAAALGAARAVLSTDHPDVEARRRISANVPEFVLFTNEDRELRSSYELADEALRANPPKALANLAWVADLELGELWNAIEADNTSVARTMERRANEALEQRLGAKWSQEQISVAFNVNGTELEILIVEKSAHGADTPISERSDGLRIFIALVAFLARHDFAAPPILLVDEAETHLHYDAQADLVEVLTNDVEATQVFYTTHSPGCLPRDLGTGIRLVSPIDGRRDASELRNDFWTNERPGFTPLLFAMGAGAAAFSAFRRAVLTEGAGDMILLPTLFKLATGIDDLPYQVAPGLANHQGSGLELEETAARVVYLVDGDGGGDKHREHLVEIGIDSQRIFQFPAGTAPEDYVHPDRYLEVVNGHLAARGNQERVAITDLATGVPISKAVEDWCRARNIGAPGKPAIASALVGDREKLVLSDAATDVLSEVHQGLMAALQS